MKAWLITWEWTGDAAAVADKVVGIISSRWASKRVRDIIEFLYVQRFYNLAEHAFLYARNNRKNNPWPAISDFNGHLKCGRNPWLWARSVDKLKVVEDSSTGLETITWIELPKYCPGAHGPELVRGPVSDKFTRRIQGPVSHEFIFDRFHGCFKDGWNPTK